MDWLLGGEGDGEADVIGHGWDVAFGVAVPAEA